MIESFPAAARGRRRPVAGFLLRAGRRTLVESLYLLTAPVIAAAGLLLALGGLCVGAFGLLLPGSQAIMAGVLAPARWFAGPERWRIAKVRPGAAAGGVGRRPGPRAAASRGLWLDAAHAVVVVPVVLLTSVVTALWWLVGVMAATVGLRGLGQALLSDAAALRRRISGLERERDTARAQTVAAAAAEAAALRRLERDIHDGPQQRLVRLAMELGRAQHHLGSRPDAVREALADAIAQAQEALEELRALSRGIAPPVLADRGLRAALTALAARSTVPAEFDAGPLDRRPDAAVETAAYFAIAEALTNVAKHSQAHRCSVGLRHDRGTLRVWVTDDGVGGAALDKGHGLRGLDDRLRAAGGRLRVTSPAGGPTTIAAELPCC